MKPRISAWTEPLRVPPVASGKRVDGARVALLVDHPLRDLPGMVLTATYLARSGVDCYLVPFNLAGYELWPLVPDLVLVNYFRPNSVWLYRELAAMGIAIGVLDTEGGVMESLDAFAAELVQDADLRQQVAGYCCWGPEVAEYLRATGLFRHEQLYVTGCPRTDFYVGPLRRAARRCSPQAEPYAQRLILLNGNFSLGNPQFMTREQQFHFMVEQLHHPPQRIRTWQEGEIAGLRELAALANYLAERFPQATVVYRPHPFERMETYDHLLARRDNLHCLRTGSIDGWLTRATVVVQRGCSTSIEAFMNGVPALSPQWLPTSFERPAANETSVPFHSREELAGAVEQILRGTFQLPPQVQRQSQRVIDRWFYRLDGQAHARVAEAVLAHLSCERSPERLARCRAKLYWSSCRPWSRRWIKAQALARLGLPPNWKLRSNRRRPYGGETYERWRHSSKFFDAAQVDRLVQAIASATVSEEISPREKALPAQTGKDYAFGVDCGYAVKVTCRFNRMVNLAS